MQNLAISKDEFENYKSNVVYIKDWIAGKDKAVKAAGTRFQDNPDGTWKWSGFGETALTFAYYPIEWHRRIIILSGSIRSGKTTVMIEKWLDYCTQNPFGLKVIIGVSKDTVYQNILSDLFNYLDSVGTEYKYNQSNGYLKVKYGKGRKDWFVCKVIGSKDKGSVKYLRGVTLSGAYVDELTLIDPAFFKELLGRCSIENSKIFCTTNPDSPNHWAYTQFVKDGANKDVEVWEFLLTDNPTLSKEYVEFISRQYKGTFYARFILGKWIVAEGLVYSTFNPDAHIIPHAQILEMITKRQFIDYVAGTDWGWNDPTACGIYGVTRDFKYYLIDEVYKQEFDQEKVIAWLKEKEAEYQIFINYAWGDNARPEQNIKLQAAGYRIIDKKPTSIAGSISVFRAIVNLNRFYMSDKCVHTKDEFLSYRYPTEDERSKKSLRGDDPIDEFNHAMDRNRCTIVWYENKFNKYGTAA